MKREDPLNLRPEIGEAARLLMEDIRGCSEARNVLNRRFGAEPVLHPCCKVVGAQFEQGTITTAEQWHAPEPWTGDLERAQLLFVSSNPSFHHGDTYPDFPAHDGSSFSPVHFFHNRFHDVRFTDANAMRARHRDGSWHSVGFWKDLQKLAQDILGETAGRLDSGNVAFTEIVHCKSKKELGVKEATSLCTERYLSRILRLAGNCRIVVSLGSKARAALMSADSRLQENFSVYAREGTGRCYATTCHPSYLRRPASPAKIRACLLERGSQLLGNPRKLSETWTIEDFKKLTSAMT